MIRGILKAAVLAGVAGLTVLGTSTTADARTFTRCDPWGNHCVRVHCNWDGDRCWRQSHYYGWRTYQGRGHWVCDRFGDHCRWVYYGRYRHHPW